MKGKPSHPLLDSLRQDIEFYNDVIYEVAMDVLKENISQYPIFVAHQYQVDLGEVILDKDELEREWTINASILEELLEKGLVEEQREKDFREIYKDPKKYICIFLITERGGNFIWLPYKQFSKDLKKENSDGRFN
ncbi:MAG: hypothetical protein WD077_09570 [Bacteroidia bacterium]